MFVANPFVEMIIKPDITDVPEYYQYYINLVKSDDLMTALNINRSETVAFLKTIHADKESYRYAPEKWSIKEVLQHIIDTERIFIYRALRFSRKDTTPLHGFDENFFAANAHTDSRNLYDLLMEYNSVRESTLSLYSGLTNDMLDFKGTANDTKNSARTIGWMIVGHNIHHCNVIQEKYLK